VGAASTNPAVAKSFIDFLASSAAIRIQCPNPVIKSEGFWILIPLKLHE
jgi:hypothetical protein